MATSTTLLLVDDDSSVLLMQKMLLESAGFRVLTAASGTDALKLFESETVDLVVMDYFMPELNGIETARVMKQLKPDVPILFLSAYSELPGETLGLAHSWVQKGQYQPEEFLARLHGLAQKSRLTNA